MDHKRTKVRTCERCGEEFLSRPERKQRYCTTKCSGAANGGERNCRYNGGLCQDPAGRWRIMCRDGTQMYYYRGVMAAQVGRLLREDEIVHHIDEDPSNDDPANLQIVTRAEHIEMHRRQLQRAA